MGSGEVAIVALYTMISLKVTFSDGLRETETEYMFGAFHERQKSIPQNQRVMQAASCSWAKCGEIGSYMIIGTIWSNYHTIYTHWAYNQHDS